MPKRAPPRAKSFPGGPMIGGPDKSVLAQPQGAAQFTLGDMSGAPPDQVSPELQHRYRLQREIGRGGAAHVYLGSEPVSNAPIAVKVLRAEHATGANYSRFQREIEIVRSLKHPNILSLLEFGAVGSQLYFTMPYVEGSTLRRRIREQRQLKIRDALAIARDVARALDFAHAKGVIHRDIKPANILLDKDRTLVADFGIARAMIVLSGEEITPTTGIAIGTVEYMSPEQGDGSGSLDGRSDIYSLACVVYEMLAGEPPFTGPTAQAVIARHCLEAPRSIRIIRRAVPVGVQRAIERALSKVPADRFDTATAFVDAMEDGMDLRTDVFGFTRLGRRPRIAFAGVLLALAAATTTYVFNARPTVLDVNRVVVFPLHDANSAAGGDGENVATYVGYALDGTRPLKWLDGWELLPANRRDSPHRLPRGEADRLSRQARAAFYIDGAVMRQPDSVTVILRLHDVGGDSVIRIEGRSAHASVASLPILGLRAVGALLPSIIAPGGRPDLGGLTDRVPSAVAHFLQGEREYRRMRFRAALPHYQAALRDDSAFVLAALRGAYAANWMSELSTATALADLALRHPRSLPLSQHLLGRGLRAYLVGDADSAVSTVRRALRQDSTIHAGWTLLGEIITRQLPNHVDPALAVESLKRARAIDPDFAPTLLLLEVDALRRGDIKEALALRDALRNAGADTTHADSRSLMHNCVRLGPQSIDWAAAIRHNENAVLFSAKSLGARGSQPRCAFAAYRALLETAGSSANARWAALVGLQTMLAATNRVREGTDVFDWKGVADLPRERMYLLLASQGYGYRLEAARVADSSARSYAALKPTLLWQLAHWELRNGNTERITAIAAAMHHVARSSQTRRDSLLAESIDAMLLLANGDTTGAIGALRALRPSATRLGIAWEPWESLGSERLLLAQLLLARGDFEGSLAIASLLDATEPLVYPLYLRPSLELRIQSAEALRNETLVSRYRHRLADLTQVSP